MTKWCTYRLKELCSKIGSGATPKGGDASYKKSGISLIRSQNVLDFDFSEDGLAFIDEDQAERLSNVEVNVKDVLVNITGDSVARVCSVPDKILPARVNQHVAILRANHKILPELLKYVLLYSKNKERLLSLASTGATRKALTKGMLEEFEVSIPVSIAAQRIIVDTLSALDRKIELNRCIIRTLEEIATLLFDQWFVTNIDEENLPTGWKKGVLKDEFNIVMGQSPDGSSYNIEKQGMPFFQGRTDFGFRFPTRRIYTSQPKRTANRFDVLLSVRAPVGDLNLAMEDCCIGRGVASVNHKNKKKSYAYYKMLSLKRSFDPFNAEGTVFGSINKNSLSSIPVTIPSSELINKFEKVAGVLDDQIYNHHQELNNLEVIKKNILPHLLSGEIDLENINLNTPLHESVLG